MVPSGWLGPTWHLFGLWVFAQGSAEITRFLGIHAHLRPSLQGGWGPTLGYFLFYWTRPPSVGGSIPRHYRYKLQLDGAMIQYMCSIYVRTSLGALLSMMMNVALKSELLVGSWA